MDDDKLVFGIRAVRTFEKFVANLEVDGTNSEIIESLGDILEKFNPNFIYEQFYGQLTINEISFGLSSSYSGDSDHYFNAGPSSVSANSVLARKISPEIWLFSDRWGDSVALALRPSKKLDEAGYGAEGSNTP